MRSNKEKNIFPFIKQTIENVYASYGYDEINIPMFVNADLYRKYKGVPGNKFIKFIDRTGDVLVIRPDATFNILKKVNACGAQTKQRYYYQTEIVRYMSEDHESNQFLQSGIEFFNDSSPICDSEVISIGIKSLLALGIDKIRVDIGHSDYIYALFEDEKKLSKKDHQLIHEYIAQKNTVDLDLFLTKKKIDQALSEKVLDLCMLFGDYKTVIKQARDMCINDTMEKALDNIEQIYACMEAYDLSSYVYLDLGFSNPMDYYSGMIFKIYADEAREEVISGGRYDALASKFGSRKHACGFGHNLEISEQLLRNSKTWNDERVLISCLNVKHHEGIKLAENIRRNYGLTVELNSSKDKFNIKYKNKKFDDSKEFIKYIEGAID